VRSVVAVVVGASLAACESSAPAKAEAAAVSHAVNVLRDADNEKKRDLLAALRNTSCSAADVCAVRSQCLAAYELHVDVLARLATLTAKADSGNVGEVERTKADLTRSHDLGKACVDAQGEMIRRYKL
jgi:hypothetical protein